MRTPVNGTKQFINDLVGTINIFFKKISKNQIQFQLSDHYTFPKKSDGVAKGKPIKKESKAKLEENAQKLKVLKAAFKRYRDSMNKNEQLLEKTKNITEKERNKYIKQLWKGLEDEDKMKWTTQERKKKSSTQGKLKAKVNDTKAGKTAKNE